MEDTVSKNEKDVSHTNPPVQNNATRAKATNWINDFKNNTLTRIQKFETQLGSVTKERNKIFKDLKNATAQLDLLKEARTNLTDEVQALKKSLESVQHEFKYAEEEKVDALERIHTHEEKIISLEEHKRSLEADLKSAKDALLVSKELQEELRGKIRLLEDKLEWNEKFHQEDLNKIKETESQLDKAKQSQESLERDVKDLTKRLDTSEIKNGDLTHQVKVLEEKIVSFEIVKRDLSRTKKEHGDALQKITALENQLQSTTALKDALEMDLKSLLKDLESERNFGDEYKKRIDDLERDLINFETVKTQLADETKLKNDAHKRVYELEHALDAERALKESLQAELEAALNSIATLKKEKDEMSTVYEDIKAKDALLEELKSELTSVEEERTEAVVKIQELNDALENTTALKDELEVELQQLKEAMDTITGALADTDGSTSKQYDLSDE